MLTKRRVNLGSPVLAEPILRLQLLEDARRADELLSRAEAQAEQLLLKAHEQRQQYLDDAVASFWGEANALLQDIRDERAAYQHNALSTVDSLLNIALSRLLDETDLPERIRALLRNLTDSLPSKAQATLTCHPEITGLVQDWLNTMRLDALWQVEADPALAADALRLSTALGAFHIDWPSLRRGLMPNLATTEPAQR